MSRRTLRSNLLLFSLGDVHFHRQDALEYRDDKLIQLPTNKFVVERFYTITKDLNNNNNHNNQTGSANEAVHRIACELEETWIYCNIFHVCRTAIKTKINSLLKEVQTLKKTGEKRRSSKAFQTRLDKLRGKLHSGFDSQCYDTPRQDELYRLYKVKMLQDEENLWCDNCVPNDNGSVSKNCILWW